MDNSNDLRSPLRRLMEEVRSHYEVTYSPVSTNFDGHFRKLAVHLTRPGVTVQSRAGYYALPMVGGEALAPFEMAALKVLTTKPEPHAFAFHAAISIGLWSRFPARRCALWRNQRRRAWRFTFPRWA
jgi:hypothetical protein